MSELQRESKKYASINEMIDVVLKELELEEMPRCLCRFLKYDQTISIAYCFTACTAPCKLFSNHDYLPEVGRTEYIERVKILAVVIQGLMPSEDKRKRWRKYVNNRNTNSRSKMGSKDS